jgi:N-carbamoyl-L-amino-acid hydrolase
MRGRGDHAGTAGLGDRGDPMLRQAAAVLAARAAAVRHGGVATIGGMRVEPNAVNAVPARVQAWLDARGEDEATVRAIVDEVGRAAGIVPEEESWTPRVDLDAVLRDQLAKRLAGAPAIATGAGHDAGILSLAGIPTAMLFVRNPTGISHAPAEHAERDDCLAGVAALADVMADLACQ